MANWSDLKSSVASIIKTNGNQEITGQLLQNALNNIISNVGANSSFAGIATPETNPGTPDGNVFYLATTAGTYSNFNGIVINSGEAVILEWRGSWLKKTAGFATQEKVNENRIKISSINNRLLKEKLKLSGFFYTTASTGKLIAASSVHNSYIIQVDTTSAKNGYIGRTYTLEGIIAKNNAICMYSEFPTTENSESVYLGFVTANNGVNFRIANEDAKYIVINVDVANVVEEAYCYSEESFLKDVGNTYDFDGLYNTDSHPLRDNIKEVGVYLNKSVQNCGILFVYKSVDSGSNDLYQFEIIAAPNAPNAFGDYLIRSRKFDNNLNAWGSWQNIIGDHHTTLKSHSDLLASNTKVIQSLERIVNNTVNQLYQIVPLHLNYSGYSSRNGVNGVLYASNSSENSFLLKVEGGKKYNLEGISAKNNVILIYSDKPTTESSTKDIYLGYVDVVNNTFTPTDSAIYALIVVDPTTTNEEECFAYLESDIFVRKGDIAYYNYIINNLSALQKHIPFNAITTGFYAANSGKGVLWAATKDHDSYIVECSHLDTFIYRGFNIVNNAILLYDEMPTTDSTTTEHYLGFEYVNGNSFTINNESAKYALVNINPLEIEDIEKCYLYKKNEAFVTNGELNGISNPKAVVEWLKNYNIFNVYMQDEAHKDIYYLLQMRLVEDNTDLVYLKEWRLNTVGGLYKYVNGGFVSQNTKLLYGNENEFTLKFKNKIDFTGGVHGDERIDVLDSSYAKFFIDGIEITEEELSSNFTKVCDSFYLLQRSTLHDTSEVDGSYVEGHPIVAEHFKKTEISNCGYKTFNKVIFDFTSTSEEQRQIETWFAGLCCVANDCSNRFYGDTFEIIQSADDNKSHSLGKTITSDVNFLGGEKKVSCHVRSKVLTENDNDCTLSIWDRDTDTKYYRYAPTRIVKSGDVFASEMEVRWSYKKN